MPYIHFVHVCIYNVLLHVKEPLIVIALFTRKVCTYAIVCGAVHMYNLYVGGGIY